MFVIFFLQLAIGGASHLAHHTVWENPGDVFIAVVDDFFPSLLEMISFCYFIIIVAAFKSACLACAERLICILTCDRIDHCAGVCSQIEGRAFSELYLCGAFHRKKKSATGKDSQIKRIFYSVHPYLLENLILILLIFSIRFYFIGFLIVCNSPHSQGNKRF